MPTLRFTKMNGAGNDFVLLDNRAGTLRLTAGQIARLCDRHRGVGADGVLFLEPAANGAQHRMRYHNADGGEAEMCGNGARCFTRFARRSAGGAGEVSFETQAGVIRAELIEGERVRLRMTDPTDHRPGRRLAAEDGEWTVHHLNTGVPHACVFVDDLKAVPVVPLGRALRRHAEFQPAGANANFIRVLGPQEIAIRTYERGVEDETLACGTGVTASALIHAALSSAASPVAVRVRGGDTLEVGFRRTSDGRFTDVTLAGPADFVFEGEIEV